MTDSANLIAQVEAAFAGTAYPGDADIVHCAYDKHWGGELDGPCRECAEVVDAFRGMPSVGVPTATVRSVSFALKSFSDAAFVYWLPSYLIAGLVSPAEADLALDSVTDIFTPPASQMGSRVPYRAQLLSRDQLLVAADWFRHHLGERTFAPFEVEPVLAGIAELARRSDT